MSEVEAAIKRAEGKPIPSEYRRPPGHKTMIEKMQALEAENSKLKASKAAEAAAASKPKEPQTKAEAIQAYAKLSDSKERAAFRERFGQLLGLSR